MTDNRTTELKSLSKLKMAGKLRFWRGTIEISESELHSICDEIQAEHEKSRVTTLESEINGDTSDGYHTFNELYHHRAVLFSVIVRDHRELAWKARKHYDGTMYDNMFIVGVETPEGQATYHYDLDPYWDMFDCEEREYAPEWDGHTPDEAIARIAMLGKEINEVVDVDERNREEYEEIMDKYVEKIRLGLVL